MNLIYNGINFGSIGYVKTGINENRAMICFSETGSIECFTMDFPNNEVVDKVKSFCNEFQLGLLNTEYTDTKEADEKILELERSFQLDGNAEWFDK